MAKKQTKKKEEKKSKVVKYKKGDVIFIDDPKKLPGNVLGALYELDDYKVRLVCLGETSKLIVE